MKTVSQVDRKVQLAFAAAIFNVLDAGGTSNLGTIVSNQSRERVGRESRRAALGRLDV
jgi:hypothetical protein